MVKVRVKVWDRLKSEISKTTLYLLIQTCNLWNQRQMLTPIRHPCQQCARKTKTYLKVTTLTVAPSGRCPRHLPTSSDMDGQRILTCITGDLAAPSTITHLFLCASISLSVFLISFSHDGERRCRPWLVFCCYIWYSSVQSQVNTLYIISTLL